MQSSTHSQPQRVNILVQKAFEIAIIGPRKTPEQIAHAKTLLSENLFPLDPSKAPDTDQTVILNQYEEEYKHAVEYSITKIISPSADVRNNGYAYGLAPIVDSDKFHCYLLLMGQFNSESITPIGEWIEGHSQIVIIASNELQATIVQRLQLQHPGATLESFKNDFLPFNIIHPSLLKFEEHSSGFWGYVCRMIVQGIWNAITWCFSCLIPASAEDTIDHITATPADTSQLSGTSPSVISGQSTTQSQATTSSARTLRLITSTPYGMTSQTAAHSPAVSSLSSSMKTSPSSFPSPGASFIIPSLSKSRLATERERGSDSETDEDFDAIFIDSACSLGKIFLPRSL